MSSFAWTPGTGSYKHYPPYVNLTGNRLTVRGEERFDGLYYHPGHRVVVELPAEQIALLSDALRSA